MSNLTLNVRVQNKDVYSIYLHNINCKMFIPLICVIKIIKYELDAQKK